MSTPSIPSGPTSGASGTLYEFIAGGSTSSLGNAVQYSFDWGDGHSSGWTPNGVTMSFHAWSAPGTYTVTAQARSSVDNSAVSSFSDGLVVTITGETISTPSAPTGPASAVTGTPGAYSAGGSVSSVGNQVRYELTWGDGSLSGWLPAGTTSASHSWPGPGTYTVTAQARSAANSQILSSISPGLTVTVAAGETISTPSAPDGPTDGTTGTSYTYSTGGAAASSGNPVAYLFDWGDGNTSGWLLPVGTTSASHTWTSPGSYTVTALAADSTDWLIRSSASDGITVNVSLAPPVITSISPTSGPAGTVVTITGRNFGATQNGYVVLWGDSYTYGTSWTDTSITFIAPDMQLAVANVAVLVGYVVSNGIPFTRVPHITSLSPAAGTVGTWVTISGTGFGVGQQDGTVTFNGIGAGTANGWGNHSIQIVVPSGATSGNVVVTVGGQASNPVSFTVVAITSVSPTTAAAGTTVTISGCGFGSTEGSGILWLGTTKGTPVSWSDTQIVATVAAIARSGNVQVYQGGVSSNTVPITINTATILTVAPAAGEAGTEVTITGSGFGASQGSGQVWLGTANGVVQSWSDTQIVAAVAAGAHSGNAMVLQNGVMSDPVPFTVNALQVASISPTSGVAGTQVTFTGTGFGAAAGVVWLGSTAGSVVSWSDTQVVATVAAGALSGIARIQQNGAWSNSVGFTVPVSNGNTLMPHLLNMSVGDSRTLQALGADGQTVTGLAWASSDSTVVSLSTDDPPVLTALAVGHATITAGSGSADVTVFAGALPIGTVIWSNPGNGSGVQSIVPAVPSPTGVADVFAFQADGTVQAITSDGRVAWSADVSQAERYDYSQAAYVVVPGTILPDFQGGLVVVGSGGIYKLDGITGQPYPAYQGGGNSVAVHPDGTIFTVADSLSFVGIDPTTGAEKFSVPLPATSLSPDQGFFCGNVIVAGDGNAYMGCGWFIYDGPDPYGTPNTPFILRASSDGAYTFIESSLLDGDTVMESTPTMITDSDQGVIMAWGSHLVGVRGTSVSVVNRPAIPVLQAQDGSFIGGTCGPSCYADYGVYGDMVAFDATGNVRWIVPNDYPQIATADGGVIGQSGIVYDQDGRATGMVSTTTQSWRGNAYQVGSVDQVVASLISPALSLWAFVGGGPSGNNTAGRPWYFKLVWENNCQDQEFQWPNCGWAFYPDNPQVNDNLASSASSQAATVKSAALAAFKKAFDKWPVTANVSEGAPGTGDNRANVVDGYLMDSKTGTMACGNSNQFQVSHSSSVFYQKHMEQAQWALPIKLVTAQDVQNALGRADLMRAIGTAIGNTAAHELGHQFFLGAYGMDDKAPNTYNSWHCDGEKMPWAWGIGGSISWESGIATQWDDMLRGGYHWH